MLRNWGEQRGTGTALLCSSCPVNLEEILRLIILIPLEPPFPAGTPGPPRCLHCAWQGFVPSLLHGTMRLCARTEGCWLAWPLLGPLLSPVCGNLRRASAPGHGRSCSQMPFTHGSEPGETLQAFTHLCLSWRCRRGWGVNGTRPAWSVLLGLETICSWGLGVCKHPWWLLKGQNLFLLWRWRL